MHTQKALQTILVKKADMVLTIPQLKLFVVKALKAAVVQSDREHRQYLVGEACRYELELLRRGEVGEIPTYDDLTSEQQDDMLAFFYKFGGSPNTLPAEVEDNIYHYPCGCLWNMTQRRWDAHCALFADGRCPQASPRKLSSTECTCVWPTHCNRCEAEYTKWWKTHTAADTLLNEEGKLTQETVVLGESDRRVLAKANQEAGHYFIG